MFWLNWQTNQQQLQCPMITDLGEWNGEGKTVTVKCLLNLTLRINLEENPFCKLLSDLRWFSQ